VLRAALVAICLAVFPAAAVAAGKTHTVRIEGMKFIPERLEVAVGDTVVWTNKDFLPHSVTAREALSKEIDLAYGDAFAFAGARCDRIVAGGMAKLEEEGAGSRS